MKQRGNGMTNCGVDFGGTDFEGVAKAMGGKGETVHSRIELRDALNDALNATSFTVISCPIGRKAYEEKI